MQTTGSILTTARGGRPFCFTTAFSRVRRSFGMKAEPSGNTASPESSLVGHALLFSITTEGTMPPSELRASLIFTI